MVDPTTLMALVDQMSGTPYVRGGDSPRGTDCSGLASLISNLATGRPAFGSRFSTGNEESALLARGFQYGTAPDALVIGWNGSHTAITLPDGTPVSSGEGGSGVKVGGGGAYQSQFTHHMFLPMDIDAIPADPAQADGPIMVPVSVDVGNPVAPPPDSDPGGNDPAPPAPVDAAPPAPDAPPPPDNLPV
jgi:hypothetical protein